MDDIGDTGKRGLTGGWLKNVYELCSSCKPPICGIIGEHMRFEGLKLIDATHDTILSGTTETTGSLTLMSEVLKILSCKKNVVFKAAREDLAFFP